MKLAISREGWLSGKETALGLLDHTPSSNAPPAGVPQKFGEGKWVLAQASSSSSDSGSELQGVSQNSSRVASKREKKIRGVLLAEEIRQHGSGRTKIKEREAAAKNCLIKFKVL
ncbi:hypothetical protein AVEN_232579-1 [Araneus ventricosus]|uniref:Uncharacterized protein n=1 Tax=Araneus ventricosus TaxID=182803 RepID=A0A4Y2QST7_ARAVE|nr:hypothetical protein AVEN_232579-1 [Araneus ventricosus]